MILTSNSSFDTGNGLSTQILQLAVKTAQKRFTSLSVHNVFDIISQRRKLPLPAMLLYDLYDGFKEILKIQKFGRLVSYTGFFCFAALISYANTSNTTRAGYSRADQFYASYPAGTELLTDTAKLYKAALGNCFETEDWDPIEFCIMAKHFERQGKSPYAYHAQYMAHLLSQGQLDGSG
ncbi:hypothetical protein SLEP1_g11099 [Rubroshorea leprosula]|uniref:Uncharacterized protein n=1 Tax=Rubroshorea leprosula TaxID=152421 RepID=A0AAV5IG09_9ROSI|nr:hypothetical protein SLEP1_g11099 [Rubroshorea leprosula]